MRILASSNCVRRRCCPQEVLHNLESHPLGELGPGDHFWEVAVLNNDDRRTAFIRAKTEVEVFILTKEDLEIVIDEHDNVEAVIRAQMDSTLAEDPLRTEAQLWAKVDPREEGWILAKKGKNLLESVMTEKGMPLQVTIPQAVTPLLSVSS